MKRLDDRGSMPLAMLVVTVGVALSATLASIVITQVKTADFNARRVQALHAAQAGLDAGLATVRGAIDSDGTGNTHLLPCGPLEGTVDETTSSWYSVSITYFNIDPQGKPVDTGEGMIECDEARNQNPVPAYVLFNSTGHAAKGASATRELRGTYIVHTDNTNISGGLIHVVRASNNDPDLCFDAGSAQPAAGAVVTMQLCNPGSTSQTWAYNDYLQMVLIASQVAPDRTSGMCMDVPYTNTNANPIARSGTLTVTMQICQVPRADNGELTPAVRRQQWSFTDSANLRGSRSDGADLDSYCLRLEEANKPGTKVIATNSCGGAANIMTFGADANTGAGQAAAKDGGQRIGQLINYNQFGRCLDATGQNVNASHMIAWPCKQNPNPAKVLWNQRYILPALPSASDPKLEGTAGNKAIGPIVMTYLGIDYCLKSPTDPALGKYVTTPVCSGAANQQWTVFGHTNQYATSYQIMDSTGKFCLQPRDPYTTTPDLYREVNKVSKIYVGPCSGSTLQKWNADKNVVDAMALKDVGEAPKISGN